jgi:iron complex outermembrane receptor protein
LGIRTNHATFNGVAALYYTRFKNRLEENVGIIPGTTELDQYFQNVGAVRAYGLELSGIWKPELLADRVYFNGNATFNKSYYEDDYTVLGGGVVASGGKDDVDSPKVILQSGITYEPVKWAVINVSGKYVDRRFSSTTNAESIGGYTVFNAYVDIGDGVSFGKLGKAKIRFNIDNLFDKNYLGTILPVAPDFAVYRPGSHRTAQVSFTLGF